MSTPPPSRYMVLKLKFTAAFPASTAKDKTRRLFRCLAINNQWWRETPSVSAGQDVPQRVLRMSLRLAMNGILPNAFAHHSAQSIRLASLGESAIRVKRLPSNGNVTRHTHPRTEHIDGCRQHLAQRFLQVPSHKLRMPS